MLMNDMTKVIANLWARFEFLCPSSVTILRAHQPVNVFLINEYPSNRDRHLIYNWPEELPRDTARGMILFVLTSD